MGDAFEPFGFSAEEIEATKGLRDLARRVAADPSVDVPMVWACGRTMTITEMLADQEEGEAFLNNLSTIIQKETRNG